MSVGYPDYARRAEANLLPLITFSQVVTGEDLSAIVYVGDIPYLEIAWDATGLSDHYLVQLSFSDDDQGNTFAGASSVVTQSTATGWISFKSKGRFVQLIVNNKQNVDVSPITIYVRGSDRPPGIYDSAYLGTPLIVQTSSSVAAGGSATATASTVIAGPATLHIRQGNNNLWQAQVEYWDWLGANWVTFMFIQGAAAGQSMQARINLPAAPVRIVYTNNDTVARNMTVSVTT